MSRDDGLGQRAVFLLGGVECEPRQVPVMSKRSLLYRQSWVIRQFQTLLQGQAEHIHQLTMIAPVDRRQLHRGKPEPAGVEPAFESACEQQFSGAGALAQARGDVDSITD